MFWPLLLIILAFVADRGSKIWAAAFLSQNGPTEINTLLTVRETYNRGVAFGLFQGAGPIVGWLSILVVVGLFVYLWRLPGKERLMRAGLALIIGGALGNLIDRIVDGEVLDFIQTPIRPGIFNVADVMINLGMVLIIGAAIWSSIRAKQNVESPIEIP